MSNMPNIGTVVRLRDGRIAAVSEITPDGSGDRVVFEDGHEERVDQHEGIGEMLSEEPPTPHAILVAYLKKGVAGAPASKRGYIYLHNPETGEIKKFEPSRPSRKK